MQQVYTASGFWAGLTLGRLLTGRYNWAVLERNSWYISILPFALHVSCWSGNVLPFNEKLLTLRLVPNFIAGAVAVCFSRIFPWSHVPDCHIFLYQRTYLDLFILLQLVTRALFHPIFLIFSIGLVATLGQAGSAAFPFITGAIASEATVAVLQPIMIAPFGRDDRFCGSSCRAVSRRTE